MYDEYFIQYNYVFGMPPNLQILASMQMHIRVYRYFYILNIGSILS